ncbi:protein FAM98A-like [Asterias rubens]|uniref:protein FAM98A-like n=1 Tax=Asterias rubens TaxID=7604 RepID=UPI001454FFD8|nr:protein FAM98A-like [Asterias rubens]
MEVGKPEDDILDSLDDLGYEGPAQDVTLFNKAIEGGPSSVEFTGLISWLAERLHNLSGIENTVSTTSSADEAESFELELSSLLSELNCPYSALTQGEMINRFGNQQNRLRVLDFLTSELQAAKIIASRPKKVEAMEVDKECGWHVSSQHLRNICKSLKLSKPPAGVTDIQLFNKIEDEIRTTIGKAGPGVVGKPILKKKLSEQQWAKLGKINERMRKEYTLRRQMLLKRLDVTVQSFQWSERVKGKLQNDLVAAYRPKRSNLLADSPVTIANLMAAREELAKLRKTSSGSVRTNTKCAINKVIMGHVPDRGGRPLEATPPARDMPSFRKRTEQPKAQRPQGGQGGRGDKVQGGWSAGGRGGQGGGGRGRGWKQQGDTSNSRMYQQGGNQGADRGGQQGGYQGGGGGYQGGGGGYNQGGGAGYNQGGGAGFNQGGGAGYNQGGGYQGGGGGYQGGGGYRGGGGGTQGGGYQGGGGGHKRGGRGRGGKR